MQTLMRQVFVAAGLYMIVTATSAWAQQAQPVRVRGEITKVDGNTLSIKSRDGQNLTVKLAATPELRRWSRPHWPISRRVHSSE
jgi:hypothetical protein